MAVRHVVLDGSYNVVSDSGSPVAIRLNGAELTQTALVPGYVPLVAVDVFGLKVLELEKQSASGHTHAFWILDDAFNYLAGQMGDLPEDLLGHVNLAIMRFASDLIRYYLPGGAPPSAVPDRLADEIAALSALHLPTVTWLLNPLFALPATRPCPDPRPAAEAGQIRPGWTERLNAILNPLATEWQDEAVSNRCVGIVCPSTGQPLTSRWSLPLDALTTAYPFVDGEGEPLILFVGVHHHAGPIGVFCPGRGEIWCKPDTMIEARNAMLGFLAQMVQRASEVAEYLQCRPARCATIVNMWHVGHHLFNELSGLERITTNGVAHHIDTVLLSNPGQTQHFGPIGHYFPDMRSRILQTDDIDPARPSPIYAHRLFLVRVTDNYLPLSLIDRIHAFVSSTTARPAARVTGDLRILIGLRVENRTWINQADGLETLLAHIRRKCGRLTVIIDGHNRALNDPDTYLRSFREETAETPPILIEHGIVDRLRSVFRGDSGLEIVSCIGMSVPENLAHIATADFFVAPWGAGLAKYRWVYNLPGLILCSNWNRRHRRDLMIYESENLREGATRCAYLSEEAIEDLEEDVPLVANWKDPSFQNFKVDEEALCSAVDTLIHELPPHQPQAPARRKFKMFSW